MQKITILKNLKIYKFLVHNTNLLLRLLDFWSRLDNALNGPMFMDIIKFLINKETYLNISKVFLKKDYKIYKVF